MSTFNIKNKISMLFLVGQVASTEFVAIDNGAGCDLSVDVEKGDCTTAATKLGFLGSFESGSWGNKPPGCFVGNSDDIWARIYFNEMSEGTLGMSKYKSICQKGKIDFIMKTRDIFFMMLNT